MEGLNWYCAKRKEGPAVYWQSNGEEADSIARSILDVCMLRDVHIKRLDRRPAKLIRVGVVALPRGRRGNWKMVEVDWFIEGKL